MRGSLKMLHAVRLIPILGIVVVILGVRVVGQDRARARDLGIEIGIFRPGPLNAITDVAGVKVGQTTLIQGDSVRTGVTVILPHGGDLFREKVPAAVYVTNGFGKLVGTTQIEELGTIETPVSESCDRGDERFRIERYSGSARQEGTSLRGH